jgi:hypothetical protein
VGHLRDGARHGDPGIVEEEVHAVELLECRVGQGDHGIARRHVGQDADGLDAQSA